MASKSNTERLDRLEQVVQILAEDQISLQKIVAELATETRRGFDRVADQFAETDRRMRETDQRFRETDQRIDKLVVAIGEFIRKNPNRN
jgi:conjugal transfer/entry exclusion protein